MTIRNIILICAGSLPLLAQASQDDIIQWSTIRLEGDARIQPEIIEGSNCDNSRSCVLETYDLRVSLTASTSASDGSLTQFDLSLNGNSIEVGLVERYQHRAGFMLGQITMSYSTKYVPLLDRPQVVGATPPYIQISDIYVEDATCELRGRWINVSGNASA